MLTVTTRAVFVKFQQGESAECEARRAESGEGSEPRKILNLGTWKSQQDNVQKSPADAGIPARRKNDEKNSSISKL